MGAKIKQIREAVADYMKSEGCSCCSDIDGHKRHKAILARLLRVPKYKDGSGYDFGRFGSKEKKGG
jgi:methionine aminopeptidase